MQSETAAFFCQYSIFIGKRRQMIYRTYISKFNTIVQNSDMNHGLSPTCELVYGVDGIVSRALIYFDHSIVKKKWEKGEMPDMEKMTHTLHIFNAASIHKPQIHKCGISSYTGGRKLRAVSFDLIFFLIPMPWDNGKGFTYHDKTLVTEYYPYNPMFDETRLKSNEASNWYQRRNGLPWEHEGVYDREFLSKECDKYLHGEDSVVIGIQRFDLGNEDIDLDITEVFNKFLDGTLENNGIGIAFSPMTEALETDVEEYLGLMTHVTPTFFEPYVETVYHDRINDDRSNFTLDKRNRLYLYSTVGSSLADLDELPIVKVTNSDDEVVIDGDGMPLDGIQAHKYTNGVYYVDILLKSDTTEPNTMIYDTWTNIKYNGVSLGDVELYANVRPTSAYFQIGNAIQNEASFTPSISGIQEREQIARGDIRKLVIIPRPNYTTSKTQLIDDMEIRIYVKDGTSEYDVVKWDCVEKTFLENYYILDTNILVPQRYYVDVKIHYGMSSIIHHDVLQFDIVNNITKKYK